VGQKRSQAKTQPWLTLHTSSVCLGCFALLGVFGFCLSDCPEPGEKHLGKITKKKYRKD